MILLTYSNPILGLLFICIIILIVIHETLKRILKELRSMNNVTRAQAKLLGHVTETYMRRDALSKVTPHGSGAH